MVSETIDKIRSLIDRVSELQRPYVQRICPACKDPCCARVHYLFGEKDILYLRLSGTRQSWRREGFMKKGCWFLGPTGCSLDLHARPFICHSYICPDLESAIRESSAETMAQLREMFRIVGLLRGQMWAEYLDDSLSEKRRSIEC